MPEAAICVQDIDVQCVLQFTLIHAAGCALHRHTSRVIHRLELSRVIFRFVAGSRRLVRATVRTGIDPTRSWRHGAGIRQSELLDVSVTCLRTVV